MSEVSIDKEMRERWVRKLEENPPKTCGMLGSPETGMCCLGWLCEVAGVDYKTYDDAPSISVAESVGLSGEEGDIRVGDSNHLLSGINDYGRYTATGESVPDHAAMAAFIRRNAGVIFTDLEPGDVLERLELEGDS